jgi:hypothetical protein
MTDGVASGTEAAKNFRGRLVPKLLAVDRVSTYGVGALCGLAGRTPPFVDAHAAVTV